MLTAQTPQGAVALTICLASLVFIDLGNEGWGFKAAKDPLGSAYSDLGGWVSRLALPEIRNVFFSGARGGMQFLYLLSGNLLPEFSCWEGWTCLWWSFCVVLILAHFFSQPEQGWESWTPQDFKSPTLIYTLCLLQLEAEVLRCFDISQWWKGLFCWDWCCKTAVGSNQNTG